MISISTDNVEQILGCLLKKPSILKSTEYKFDVSEFESNSEKILFSCIYNMHKSGISDSIGSYQFFEYLKNFNTQWYNIYLDFDSEGLYIEKIISSAKLKNFDFHYNRFKKFTLLKELQLGGWDTTRVYDATGVNTQLNMEFETKEINEILDSLFVFNSNLKKKWCSSLDDDSEMTNSGDGLDDLIANFKTGQTFGVKLNNPVINSIAKGAREGKILLLGAGSGLGK